MSIRLELYSTDKLISHGDFEYKLTQDRILIAVLLLTPTLRKRQSRFGKVNYQVQNGNKVMINQRV